jgi:hypothetical protein
MLCRHSLVFQKGRRQPSQWRTQRGPLPILPSLPRAACSSLCTLLAMRRPCRCYSMPKQNMASLSSPGALHHAICAIISDTPIVIPASSSNMVMLAEALMMRRNHDGCRYDLQRLEVKGTLSDRAVASALSLADLPWLPKLPEMPKAHRPQPSERLFKLLQATGARRNRRSLHFPC